jgi:glycosyltransferase involved in cell wall biosynthesis
LSVVRGRIGRYGTMPRVKLSILMPVYNESATVVTVVKRVLDVQYPCEVELVAVDDGSRDGSADLLEALDDPRLKVVRHERNKGKGAAIRTAADHATGDSMIIVDADLEYSPDDIPKLVDVVLKGEAKVVYGTRSFGSHTAFSFWYVMGNKVVTLAANVLFDAWLSDIETCFKLMPLDLYRQLAIRSAGFGMEAEVTGKLLRRGVRPYEVPISYVARSREEGKKLTWKDGVEALWILAATRFGWPLRTTR